jgi:hypothetical protein
MKKEIKVKGGEITIVTTERGYFSITAWFGGDDGWGGACHDEILALRPDLAPFVALHLSDLEGVPLHVLGNGFYWIDGIVNGEFGSEYHGSKDGRNTPHDCYEIAKKHFRIDDAELDLLIEGCRVSVRLFNDNGAAKDYVSKFCDRKKLHWKLEANKALELLEKINSTNKT